MENQPTTLPQSEQAIPMPAGLGPRFKYTPIIARIVTGDGEWVRIELDEIVGDNLSHKQTRLGQAARQRNLKITSTFRYQGACSPHRRSRSRASMSPVCSVPTGADLRREATGLSPVEDEPAAGSQLAAPEESSQPPTVWPPKPPAWKCRRRRSTVGPAAKRSSSVLPRAGAIAPCWLPMLATLIALNLSLSLVPPSTCALSGL
jgi:hypothetical protein